MRKLLSLIRNGTTATEQTNEDDETGSGLQSAGIGCDLLLVASP